MPIRSSYELTRLFLALSDVSRLEILNQLNERTSVVDMCRQFDLLVHEVVRHLRRLEDVGLVHQLPHGDYVTSEYGKVVTTFVEGINDVHDLLEYWERHSAAELPEHLKRLPADLSGFFISEGDLLVTAAMDIVREAKSFLWVLNYVVDTTTVNASAVEVLCKRTSTTEGSSVRCVEGVNTVLLLNEFCALICFPRVTAREGYEIDTSCGFLVTAAHITYRRLAELFDFFWENSRYVNEDSNLNT
ncbi:MAG: ArsR family transcriptional regulator [Halobacteriota archaeon]